MQEAFVVFLLCQRRYTGHVDNPAWFMALYKTAWRNRLVTLATTTPRYSLLEGLDIPLVEAASPDVVHELLELLEALPFGLRALVTDMCRPKGRLKISRRSMHTLRSLLQAS